MISNRLFGAFTCVLAVLSAFVPVSLLTSEIEIPRSSRRHATPTAWAFRNAMTSPAS
jgi:hypothetical protein